MNPVGIFGNNISKCPDIIRKRAPISPHRVPPVRSNKVKDYSSSVDHPVCRFRFYTDLGNWLSNLNNCPFSLVSNKAKAKAQVQAVLLPSSAQTWKKARTRRHCPRKFLRIAAIFLLWKIMHLYFQKKRNNLWKWLMKHLIFSIFIAYKWWFPQ